MSKKTRRGPGFLRLGCHARTLQNLSLYSIANLLTTAYKVDRVYYYQYYKHQILYTMT